MCYGSWEKTLTFGENGGFVEWMLLTLDLEQCAESQQLDEKRVICSQGNA